MAIRRNTIGAFAATCRVAAAALLLASMRLAQADPLEAVYSLDVDNPAVLVAALDKLLESRDLRGHRMALWAAEFDGADPRSHVLVTEFDDYAAFEELTAKRRGSPDWLQYVFTAGDAATTTASLMVIQRKVYGEGWRGHGALAAYLMTVSDPAAYAVEFDKLIGSMEHPGSVRLMEVRAGGEGITHVVLITGPGFAAVNEYLDQLLSGEAYAAFAKAVAPIRSVRTVEMYRRVKTWED